MKICKICTQPKELDEFTKSSKSLDGRGSYCRPCHREYTKQWTADNLDRVRGNRKRYNSDNAEKISVRNKVYKAENKEYFLEYNRQYYKDKPEKSLLYEARKRAKEFDLPFTIVESDISIPKICPVLGTEIEKGSTMNNRDKSPSLDRVVPSLGYIPGNIAVISYRANRMKNDGTADEHRRIAEWMDAFSQPVSEVA